MTVRTLSLNNYVSIPITSRPFPDGPVLELGYRNGGTFGSKVQNGVNSSGSLSDNPYNMTYERWLDMPVKIHDLGANTIRTDSSMSLFGIPTPAPLQPWDSNDELQLINRLIHNIRQHDFNGGNVAGEAKKTLEFIGDTATRIGSALISARRGRLVDAASKLGVIPNSRVRRRQRRTIHRPSEDQLSLLSGNWLALQYGWLPLLGDAHSAGQALAATYNKPIVRRYRNRGHKESSVEIDGVLTTSSVKRQIIAVMMENEHETVNQSLGLADPLSVAWELTPWSFVVDWFLPVGDYLNARGALRTIKLDHIVNSTLSVVEASSFSTTNQNHRIINGGFRDYLLVKMNRSIEPTISLPLPNVKPLSDALSFKRVANALALLVGVRDRISRPWYV
jgi:hypothetical protein